MTRTTSSTFKTRLSATARNVLRRPLRWALFDVRQELKTELKSELKLEIKAEVKEELKAELKTELKAELWTELKAELKTELRIDKFKYLLSLDTLKHKIEQFIADVNSDTDVDPNALGLYPRKLRQLVRSTAGLTGVTPEIPEADDIIIELLYICNNVTLLKPAFAAIQSKRVLYCGQSYYNAWYLSRSLRSLGWKADVYNWDENPASQIYYHGQDFHLGMDFPATVEYSLEFYLSTLYDYDVIHFSNANGISYGWRIDHIFKSFGRERGEIYLLKELGKKIVYSNNGCLDGVSQTAFAKWGPESVCAICPWQDAPTVCSDEKNLNWGKFRNSVADYQCTLGGNRADYNDDPTVHEVPEFYCLDPDFWHPGIEIPEKYRLPESTENVVRLYHAVGNREMRTRNGVNIKSTHIYLPLIERLRNEGIDLDLIQPTGIPNREVRFLQLQSDIVLDMLTFGWFGANVREAMMLAKPVICFIRPEWLESVRREIPEYAEELPIVSATPHTVEMILRDLIAHPEKRIEIGRRSREFAVKWHSDDAAGRRFDRIYGDLLNL